ncbi:hypothetical protein PPERSA_05842 [Pseudocohnilembus persalinus]|uniref:Uncharacterized protein n=1 Tax=Pseudocohnilembus persalinus TaxID=266149 RepID=A0A0V0R4L8_PSEPJ|nr:hypothetical protein PPERSA_05842 [Pseudocohnilembus persalinus]|eukprot:KRX09173.1 hypothetical protein PPERSA_05842 [Pseudocohnilembus persalinus]
MLNINKSKQSRTPELSKKSQLLTQNRNIQNFYEYNREWQQNKDKKALDKSIQLETKKLLQEQNEIQEIEKLKKKTVSYLDYHNYIYKGPVQGWGIRQEEKNLQQKRIELEQEQINRLFQEAKLLEQKKQKLTKNHTPTFRPNLTKISQELNEKVNKKRKSLFTNLNNPFQLDKEDDDQSAQEQSVQSSIKQQQIQQNHQNQQDFSQKNQQETTQRKKI